MDSNSNICRLCLLDNAVVKIFGNRKPSVVEMIKRCCQFEIFEEENLPRKLCLKCLNTLNICNDFLLQCIQNNKKLLQQVIKIDDDIIKVEQKYLIKCEFDNEVDVEIYDDNPNESYFDNEDHINDDQIDDIKPVINNQLIEVNNAKRSRRNIAKKNYNENIKKKKTKKNTTRQLIKDNKNESTKECQPSLQYVKKSYKPTEEVSERIVCDFCGKSIKRSYMKDHVQTHSTDRKFNCELCSRNYKTRSDLSRHMKTSHIDNSVTCDICKKVYSNRSCLKSHMTTVHLRERNHPCEVCDKKFKANSLLKLHMRTHTHEKPYQCNFCDSSFALPRSKREHERLHTGDTPYKCPTCSKGFAQLCNMKSHFKHNHKEINFKEVYKPAKVGKKRILDTTTVQKDNIVAKS